MEMLWRVPGAPGGVGRGEGEGWIFCEKVHFFCRKVWKCEIIVVTLHPKCRNVFSILRIKM